MNQRLIRLMMVAMLAIGAAGTVAWAAPSEPVAVGPQLAVAASPEAGAPANPTPEANTVAPGEHGEATAPEGEHAVGLLSADLGTIVWTIVLFVLLLAVLGKWVWPPVVNALQEREGKIRGDLEHAERAAAEAQATLDQYKQQLAEARKEGQRIVEQSRADAQKVASDLKEQVGSEMNHLRKRAQQEIISAKEQALAEIYEQTATLATQVAGRILRREIQPGDQRALVDASLSELAGASEN